VRRVDYLLVLVGGTQRIAS